MDRHYMNASSIRLFILNLYILLISSTSLATTATDMPLSIETYGSLPAISRIQLSPNGQSLALVQNLNGSLVLSVLELKTGKKKYLLKSDNVNVLLGWYTWVNDETLLISARYPVKQGFNKYTRTKLYRYNLATDDELELLIKPRTASGEINAQIQTNVISLLPNEPDNILMAIGFDIANKPTVYKVNVKTKKRTRIRRPKPHVVGWIADQQGHPRISQSNDEITVYYKLYDQEGELVRKLWSYEVFEKEVIHILGFDKDPNVLFIRALHHGRYAVFKVDLQKPEQEPELIYADEKYDVDGSLIYSPKTHKVVGLSHKGENDNKIYWDETYIAFKKALNEAIPDANNTIISMTKDLNKYVLFSSSAETAGDYYLGDRTQKSLQYIGSLYPKVNEKNYAKKELIQYVARDGLKIEGYLTKPLTMKAGNKLPAIILPHGGPMARDSSGFDYWAELFASRGYIVLQPNFRGSSGYGYEFEMAALGGWGKAMQNDLQDAVAWLNSQKIIDESKVCIAGASYGGYAALMAAVLHADTFKCAASFAGVSDIERIVKNSRRYTNGKIVQKQLGDNYDELETVSPVNFAKKINIPVLLVHGTDDVVVPVIHSQSMAEELADNDKDVRYVEIKGANHHLSVQSHRIQTLEEMVNFFDKHLK